MDNYDTFLNNRLNNFKNITAKYKNPIFASLIVAFCSYMFAFTNKLVNHDEIMYLFGKGETISSGRWGLELTSLLFPDISMPWLYGIISILFITTAICLIIKIFSIKNTFFQILISGIIISFPSLIGIFSYMFTSASFALSFLLAVATVYFLTLDKRKYLLFALISLVFSVSIYQAFVAVTASLMITYLLQKIIASDDDVAVIFKKAVFFLSFLVVAMALYYGTTIAVLKILGTTFNEYAAERLVQSKGLVYNILYAYFGFFATFLGKFNLVAKPLLQIIHIVLVLVSGCIFVYLIRKKGDIKRTLLSLVFIALFPLSVCCIYLFIDPISVHSLMIYSFVSVYVFIIVIIQSLKDKEKIKKIIYDAFSVLFAVIIIGNIYTANNSYLQLHLAYENAYSYYSSVMTSIVNTPGFSSDSKIVLYKGESIKQKFDLAEILGNKNVTGIKNDLINIYSRESFINYYLGYDVQFATDDEIKMIEETNEFKEMQIYPYYGSVKKIDNYIVVKLSE